MRYKKHCVLQCLLRILKRDAAKREKCKNDMFFKADVGNARRADRHNRHFLGVGDAPTATAEVHKTLCFTGFIAHPERGRGEEGEMQ